MFDFLRFRKTDPETSKEAAKEIGMVASKHANKIIDCLTKFGPLGKSGIAYFAVLDPNQISRRLPELQKMGLIEPTGKNVKSNSGRHEREWRIK